MGDVGNSFTTLRAILQQINLANRYEQKQCPVIFFGNYISGCSYDAGTNTRETKKNVYIVLFLLALKMLHMDAIYLLRRHVEDFTLTHHGAKKYNASSFRSACQKLFASNAGDRV